jgi:hypothetical protein
MPGLRSDAVEFSASLIPGPGLHRSRHRILPSSGGMTHVLVRARISSLILESFPFQCVNQL